MVRKKTKAPVKRPAKKAGRKGAAAAAPKTPVWKITPDQQIVGALFLGKVRDYYAHIGVITLVLEAPLALGDTIRVKGHTTDLTQPVEHMEADHKSVASAAPGDGVGIKVADKVRVGDAVYKL